MIRKLAMSGVGAVVAVALVVVGSTLAGATSIYDTATTMLSTNAAGFQTAIFSWIGDLLPIVLPLFVLGLGWALFRRFGRQIVGFFTGR
jgi:hypothetical protein